MIQKNQVFIVNVIIIDLIQQMMILGVISQSASVIAKFNAIAKICKYKKFHERQHFILIAMKVHDAP
jgi:hypothetical protein